MTTAVKYLKVLLVCGLFLSAGLAWAQNRNDRVTLAANDQGIRQILEKVEHATIYRFTFKDEDLKDTKPVSINADGMDIESFLNKLLDGTGVTWKRNGNNFAIIPKPAGGNLPQEDEARTVNGIVIDANDREPVIGAYVVVKGAGEAAITDVDGKFSVKVTGNNAVLQVSFVGYSDREVLVGDLGYIEIKLGSDNTLEEAVVVGAGTQKKVSITGAIQAIKGGELTTPSTSLTTALAGKVAGIISMTNSGSPGEAGQFYIRGVSTFGGRTTPLILLDEVEISVNDLNNIPPETIESFSILKDASATAIYGVRGANGVMLITTKSGQENERAKINVAIENSFNTLTRIPEYVDGVRWMELYNEAQQTRSPGATQRFPQYEIDLTRSGKNPYVYPNVDWWDTMFNKMATSQRVNLNVQGGASKVTYYMSLQATHDSGVMKTTKIYSLNNNVDLWRYNLQANIKYKITPSTTVDLRLNDQITQRSGPDMSNDELFAKVMRTKAIAFPAVFPAQPGDTHIRFGSVKKDGSQWPSPNPYAQMLTSEKRSNGNTVNASLKVTQDLSFLTKGLNLSILANLKDWSSASYTRHISPYYYQLTEGSYNPENPINYETELITGTGTDYVEEGPYTRTSDRTFMLQAVATWNRTFRKHNVGGMLLYQQREYVASAQPERNQSFAGRATYDFDHRYLAEVNFAYNGTERLPAGSRFELFPAVSLGWVLSNESFMEWADGWMDNFKVRASYGIVGSDGWTGAPHFLYNSKIYLFSTIYRPVGEDLSIDYRGPVFAEEAVRNACWEKAYKFDVGVDMRYFNALDIVFDYYYERRRDILLQRNSWPLSMGTTAPWSNSGAVDSWGYELSANYRKELFKDFTLEVRGNFTYTDNKLVNKDEPNYPDLYMRETGRPLNHLRGYIADGLFTSQEEIDYGPKQELGSTPMVGDIKYRDLNGDGVINSSDQTMVSTEGRIPKIQVGLGINIDWKGWNLGLFFNGSFKRKFMLSGMHPFGNDPNKVDFNCLSFIADNHWSEQNPDPEAAYPRLAIDNAAGANNFVDSSFWVRDGSFVRLKTVELGWRMNKWCRFFAMGDNLFVFSPFKEWDPELDWNRYPLSRSVNIGVQLNF